MLGDFDAMALSAQLTARRPHLLLKLSVRPEVLAETGDLDPYEEPITLGLLDRGPGPVRRHRGCHEGHARLLHPRRFGAGGQHQPRRSSL